MILTKQVENAFPRSSHGGTPKFQVAWSCPPRKLSRCGGSLKWESLGIIAPPLWHPSGRMKSRQKLPQLWPSRPSQIRTVEEAQEKGAPWWLCFVFQVPSTWQPASKLTSPPRKWKALYQQSRAMEQLIVILTHMAINMKSE